MHQTGAECIWHACLKGKLMQTQQKDHNLEKTTLLPLRENHVFSWRLIAVLSLMGCIAIEVLFNLLPIDHNTLQLFWFFPVSLLLASQLYFGLRVTRYFEIKLLLLFLVWGCVTVVLNYGRAQLVDSFEWFASICTAVFLCFALPYAFEKASARRVLTLLMAATLLAAVILSVVSLIAVFAKDIAAKAPSIFEGIFIGGGRLSIDSHPNRSAPAPALGVILAGILLADVKKTWQRVLVILFGVICFIPLSLTGSRTAILGAALALAFEAALTLRHTLKGRIHTALRVCVSLTVAAIVAVGFFYASTIAQQTTNTLLARQEAALVVQQDAENTVELPQTIPAQTAESDPASIDTTASEEVITRDFSDADSFNGRTDIWSGVWNGLLENPKILLFGTGPMMASKVMSPYFPLNSPVGLFHNSLVGALVAYGVPGLLLALVLLILVALAALRLCFGKKTDQPLVVKLLPAVLLFTVAEGMMEDFLFTSVSLNIVWIWFMIAAGFVLRLDKKEDATQDTEKA